jgi:hypothetical protein
MLQHHKEKFLSYETVDSDWPVHTGGQVLNYARQTNRTLQPHVATVYSVIPC